MCLPNKIFIIIFLNANIWVVPTTVNGEKRWMSFGDREQGKMADNSDNSACTARLVVVSKVSHEKTVLWISYLLNVGRSFDQK